MDQREYYDNYYQDVVGKGGVGFLYRLYHNWLEANSKDFYSRCVEVGSGDSQHYEFVRHKFESYFELDLRNTEPVDKNIIGRQKAFGNAEDLSVFDNSSVDRLLASCVLVHLSDPEKALKEWKRVVRPGGEIDIYIPCEPGFLLRLAQILTTRRKCKKLGITYDQLHYREHRNHQPLLSMLIKDIFSNDIILKKGFPVTFGYWQFRLFEVYKIRLT